MKKRIISALLCTVLALSMLAGCGKEEVTEETTEEATEETTEEASNTYGLDMDTITVAISSGYEPFLYDDENGNLVGYDADLWAEFEERTGIKVEWERADFSGLLGLLQSGKADCVCAQLTPTPEREENFAFTEPETYYGSTLVVRSDNEEIKSVEDLAGKKIGVGSGNNMQQTVEAMYEEGELTFEVYTSATLENMLEDVALGRIDAMLAQDIQAYIAIEKSGADCKVLTPFESSVGAIAVNKDDTQLLDGLNAFLADIKADGTLSAISEKWIGADVSVESK